MKPRVLTSHKILAAALTLTCAPGAAFALPPADADGYPLVGNLVRKGDAQPPKPKPQPPPPPKPQPSPSPAPAPKAVIG